jgi:hypothetical protein
MAVAFQQLQQLNENDLFVTFKDEQGNPFDPYYISYSIFGESNTRGVWRVGLPDRNPTRFSEGYYYVNEVISTAMGMGEYHVVWTIKRTEASPLEIVGKKYFGIIKY